MTFLYFLSDRSQKELINLPLKLLFLLKVKVCGYEVFQFGVFCCRVTEIGLFELNFAIG